MCFFYISYKGLYSVVTRLFRDFMWFSDPKPGLGRIFIQVPPLLHGRFLSGLGV